MSAIYELWHSPKTRSLRVLWTLEELGLGEAVKVHDLKYPPRLHHADYLDINPLGSVPFFRHGDVQLSESMAICEYLLSRHPSRLEVRSAEAGYTAYRQYCYFGEATLMPPLSTLLKELRAEPPEQRSQNRIDAARTLFRDRQAALVNVLREQDMLAAGRFTLADISVCYPLTIVEMLGEQHLLSPEVKSYFNRLTQIPSFQRVLRRSES